MSSWNSSSKIGVVVVCPSGGYSDLSSSPPSSQPAAELGAELEAARPSTAGEEELQLQLALAMSREEHDDDLRKQRGDDMKLQMALDESVKEQVGGVRGRG